MSVESILLIAAFFTIAVVYSSVGFGGGSSYLALLGVAAIGLSQAEIRATALCCNLIVVTGGSIIFYRSGKFKWADVWPYLIASVPLAFLGGTMKFTDRTFFLILAFTLLIAAFFLWLQPKRTAEQEVTSTGITNKLLVSGGVGFLSGLVSIGGGIFLSPLLHLFRWNQAHAISGIASVYILVNSISGLTGLLTQGKISLNWMPTAALLVAVFMGGQVGSRIGAKQFNAVQVKRATAIVIVAAAILILNEWL
jgi:uncharacterized protein